MAKISKALSKSKHKKNKDASDLDEEYVPLAEKNISKRTRASTSKSIQKNKPKPTNSRAMISRAVKRVTKASLSIKSKPKKNNKDASDLVDNAVSLLDNTRTKRTRASSEERQPTRKKRQKYKLLPTNLETITTMKNSVHQRLKGFDYDQNVSLRVIRAALTLQESYIQKLKKKKKKKNERTVLLQPPRVRETICNLIGISSSTYVKIMHQFYNHQTVYSTELVGEGRGGNRQEKDTQVPHTTNVVHKFV